MGGARTWAAGAVLLLGSAAGAGAQDAPTREEMDALQRKVRELEGRLGAAPAEGKAANAGNVSAPKVRGLKFSGQVVVWGEMFDEVYRPADPAGGHSQDIFRSRIGLQADADITEGLSARIEIRDARFWGTEPTTTSQLQTSSGGLDLKQGWFEGADFLGSGVTVRAGRQVLAYGDQRLIGHLEWNTLGRSFDGALVKKTFGKTQVDLFAARVFEGGAWLAGFAPPPGTSETDDADLYGIYTQTPKGVAGGDFDVYLLGFRSGAEAAGEEAGHAGNTFFGTGGVRWSLAGEAWDAGFEGAAQSGHLAGDPLDAWAGHVHAGYTMKDAWGKPRLGVEANHATGDRDPASGGKQSFQTLFPTDHLLYGPMDLTTWKNLRELSANLTLRPAERWTVRFEGHLFWVAQEEDAWYGIQGLPIRKGGAGYSDFLGTEADVIATFKASEWLRIDLGASQFFDGGFVRDSGTAGDATWIWMQAAVNF